MSARSLAEVDPQIAHAIANEVRRQSENIELIVLPSPQDDRALLDFTESATTLEQAYKLAVRALDDYEAGPRRSKLARHWWRRRHTASMRAPT